ncbi:hypothetical protein PG999_001575 [Apiospora kogelbergensis]|uniref:Uncharacterized protein n=1 Tax=Apiospora kogelbergensis TaxID=1337665 RepID=A0AAW0R5W4_9PEZI
MAPLRRATTPAGGRRAIATCRRRTGADEAKSVTAYSNVQSVTPNTADPNYYQQHPQELDAHERVEVDGSSPLRELDTPGHQQQQHELETPESRYYAHYDEQGNTLPRT